MEKKIKFKTTTKYNLSQEELKEMYILLALSTYSYLRHPDYDGDKLLKTLRADFKKFIPEILSLIEQSPNNHNLHKIHMFFNNHNTSLKYLDTDISE